MEGTGSSVPVSLSAAVTLVSPLFCLNFNAFLKLIDRVFHKARVWNYDFLSQVNVIAPIRWKLKLYAAFVKFCRIFFFRWDGRTLSTIRTFPPISPRTSAEIWLEKLLDILPVKRSGKWFFALHCFFSSFCWNASAGITKLANNMLFFKIFFPKLFAACLKFFLPLQTSAYCVFWCSQPKHFNVHTFCWDDIFTKK